ncbi:hypothetical protein [Ovoidimarina sediminis]|uniref:hypothetical protein n=1 Tax=Ovoidimarina sediminis TaxID=3079856 RepID=UPI002907FAA5|nr:hypothetical protein [Rhodophyticola sp. MJ-SS7]MDU8942878.1 hypothetical protein [Rhodophyticola sp. MJ-SS7]
MKAPWHLWLVGIAALIWNGFGATDYVLTRYDVEAYTSMMSPEMKATLAAYPVWMDVVWALAVWLPLLAAIQLLSQRKSAAVTFGLGLIAALVAGAYNYILTDPPLNVVAGNAVMILWVAVAVIALLQWLYARAMAKAGYLV